MAAVAVDDRLAQHVAEIVLSDWQRSPDWPRSTPGGACGGTSRPWPFEDLVAAIGAHLPPVVIAARLGVNHRQVFRWRGRGLTDVQADELAHRIGLHPAMVWRDW